MTDRILFRSLWLVIMALISATAMGCLVLLYAGLFRIIGQEYEAGGIALGSAILSGVSCWALCRHCDDLIDRRFSSR